MLTYGCKYNGQKHKFRTKSSRKTIKCNGKWTIYKNGFKTCRKSVKRRREVIKVFSLKKILENVSEEFITKEIFSKFYCTYDKDIEKFLKEKAILYELKSRARTYLIFDSNLLKQGIFSLIAYFSISLQVLKLPQNFSNTKIKYLDGMYTRKKQNKISEVPAYLIGQLAKNDKYIKNTDGSKIMKITLSLISMAQDVIGGRVVYIECKNKDVLKNFYLQNGFRYLQDNVDKDYVQMFLVLE